MNIAKRLIINGFDKLGYAITRKPTSSPAAKAPPGRAAAAPGDKTSREILRFLVDSDAPTLFDVGANVGQTIASFRDALPNATIHAFEPTPDCCRQLHDQYGEVEAVRLNDVAVSDAPGEKTFYLTTGSQANSFNEINLDSARIKPGGLRPSGEITVPVTTLSKYCADNSVSHIDFLKIDVQGHELACLRGAENLLRDQTIGALKLEIIFGDQYGAPLSFHDVESILLKHDYRLFTISKIRRSPNRFYVNWVDAWYVPRTRLEQIYQQW